MDLREPEKAIYKEIISGNIPDFLRTFVEIQRRGKTLGVLTVGHKKDVVISNRFIDHPDRVAI